MDRTKITWTSKKAEANEAGHEGLTFEAACALFANRTLQTGLVVVKVKHGLEIRGYGAGEIKGVLYVIIYQPPAGTDALRIISFRRASEEERKAYYGGTFESLVQAYQRREDLRSK